MFKGKYWRSGASVIAECVMSREMSVHHSCRQCALLIGALGPHKFERQPLHQFADSPAAQTESIEQVLAHAVALEAQGNMAPKLRACNKTFPRFGGGTTCPTRRLLPPSGASTFVNTGFPVPIRARCAVWRDGVLIDGAGQKKALTAIGPRLTGVEVRDFPPRSPDWGAVRLLAGRALAHQIQFLMQCRDLDLRLAIALALHTAQPLLVQSIENYADRFGLRVAFRP
jgi:hypothetical protein